MLSEGGHDRAPGIALPVGPGTTLFEVVDVHIPPPADGDCPRDGCHPEGG